MDDKELVQAFIDYVNGEEEASKEFIEHKTWHVDMCCCQRCRNLYKWYYTLSSKERLNAKWLFFKKYMID